MLIVGEANQPLAALHKAAGVTCSAFITACNPFSRQDADVASNVHRQQALANDLAQRGLIFIEGIGELPSNGWPAEESFLVLGVSLENAKAIGKQFAQNAIVWSGDDAVPQLVLLR